MHVHKVTIFHGPFGYYEAFWKVLAIELMDEELNKSMDLLARPWHGQVLTMAWWADPSHFMFEPDPSIAKVLPRHSGL